MDCNTGHIYQLTDAQRKDMERSLKRELATITDRQAKELAPLTAEKRKGYMRNQPCVCGSGVKFKRCCWSKYA